MILKEDFKVELNAIGKENYIKNIAILEMLENIATHHSDMVGFGPNDIRNVGYSWILLDWKLNVLKRPKYGEKLNVNTWAKLIDGKTRMTSTYRDFEVYNEQGQLSAIGTSKWVLVNIETGRIAKIEEELIGKYNPEYKSVFDIEELGKIKVPEEFSNEIQYKVNRKDIDINGHMHNLYYLDLAYEALPEEIYNKRPFDNVRIQYKNEIKYGDIVKCKYTFEENNHIITICSEDETKIHAIIILK